MALPLNTLNGADAINKLNASLSKKLKKNKNIRNLIKVQIGMIIFNLFLILLQLYLYNK